MLPYIHGFLYFYSDIHLVFKIFISFKIFSFQPLRQQTQSSSPGRVYGMWLMTHPLVITRLLLYNSLYLATMHFRLFIIVDAYKNHVTNIVHQRFPISLTLDLTDSSIGIIIPLQL